MKLFLRNYVDYVELISAKKKSTNESNSFSIPALSAVEIEKITNLFQTSE